MPHVDDDRTLANDRRRNGADQEFESNDETTLVERTKTMLATIDDDSMMEQRRAASLQPSHAIDSRATSNDMGAEHTDR